jgi:hypothetical protein
LGTTNSLVAYVRDDRPVAIADCDDAVLLPSAVAYAEKGQIKVGAPALSGAAESPRDTIVSVKRFMGRGGNDPETRRLGPYLFDAAKAGEANVVRFRVRAGSDGKLITDGAFAETKEYLAGYWIVDVDSPERALALAGEASKAPGVPIKGADGKPVDHFWIEVRQVLGGRGDL